MCSYSELMTHDSELITFRIIIAAITSNPATTYKPDEVVPVRSLSQPTRNGASQPERLPIELMSAIPPAAAVPDNSIAGICQNGEKALSTPVTPRMSAANANTGDVWNTPIKTSPTAAVRQDSAQWYRRSSFRSECRPTQTM